MAEEFDVYDNAGAQIGAIPISLQQREQLHLGATVTIGWHTPRMLQHLLGGASNGAFDVSEIDGRLIVNDPEQVKRYIEMQLNIARAMQQPDKWTDPNAESDSPIR